MAHQPVHVGSNASNGAGGDGDGRMRGGGNSAQFRCGIGPQDRIPGRDPAGRGVAGSRIRRSSERSIGITTSASAHRPRRNRAVVARRNTPARRRRVIRSPGPTHQPVQRHGLGQDEITSARRAGEVAPSSVGNRSVIRKAVRHDSVSSTSSDTCRNSSAAPRSACHHSSVDNLASSASPHGGTPRHALGHGHATRPDADAAPIRCTPTGRGPQPFGRTPAPDVPHQQWVPDMDAHCATAREGQGPDRAVPFPLGAVRSAGVADHRHRDHADGHSGPRRALADRAAAAFGQVRRPTARLGGSKDPVAVVLHPVEWHSR